MVMGYLSELGVTASRARVRASMHRVDPGACDLRDRRLIRR